MTKIAYILLCHKDPEGIIAQAVRLTAAGDFVAIHFDARASARDHDRIRAALSGNPSVAFARRRVKCGWGEWSLVAATLEAVRAAVAAFPQATHFYMLSGDCMPIKTAEYVRGFLESDEADYIEAFDFFDSDWIKTGIKEERLIYRHWFNERGRKAWFYRSMQLQASLGLARKVPADLRIQIGSQWWCLRRRTVEAVLAFCDKRRDVVRFFATTWIPDETFFQTIVRHLVPDREIRSRTLTFLLFSDYGMPVTFYDDHHDMLLTQDFLFARKISADAKRLKQRLGELYAETGLTFRTSGEGKRQFQFLTGRGRIGRRFAPRFWEAETTIGRDRTLMMVTCKKWHVAKRLVDKQGGGAPAGRGGPIRIKGSQGMAVQLARCCRPIPGDPIVGTIRAGQGLVVHTHDCPTLRGAKAGRGSGGAKEWIDVEWDAETQGPFEVLVKVVAQNAPGVLARLAATIAGHDANIDNVRMDADGSRTTALYFTLQVTGRLHLAHILRSLRRLPMVTRINRLKEDC